VPFVGTFPCTRFSEELGEGAYDQLRSTQSPAKGEHPLSEGKTGTQGRAFIKIITQASINHTMS
jgi:hypothetical protein